MDLESLFAAAQRAAIAAKAGPALFGSRHWLFRDILGLLPVRAAGEHGWNPMDFGAARPRDLRPILAVRAGWDDDYASVERDHLGFPTESGRLVAAGWAALRGAEIVDLLALDWSMRKPPRRLLDTAPALGFGADGRDTAAGDGPVTLCRDVADWVGTLFTARGCLPLGPAIDQQDTIRRMAGGVVCQDLAHGMAVERLLRRDLPAPPPILVRKAA